MLNRIKEFFLSKVLDAADTNADGMIAKAAAALLIEVMMIDGAVTADEEAKMCSLLRDQLSVPTADIEDLLVLARTEVEAATSLYQFTALINVHFSAEKKYQLMRQLWLVAFADGALDKYEEGLIRHIAELIHVPHSQFLLAKKQARS